MSETSVQALNLEILESGLLAVSGGGAPSINLLEQLPRPVRDAKRTRVEPAGAQISSVANFTPRDAVSTSAASQQNPRRSEVA